MFSSITGRHTLRFVTALAVLAVVVLAVFRDGIVGPAMVPLQALAAEATLFCLRALGIGAVREVSVVYLPGGFGYEISRGCVGLVPALFLGVAISAYPAIPQRKLLGLAVGIPALLTINLARLVHLFYLGTYRPDIFHLAHEVIWQGVNIFVVFGIWLGWAGHTSEEPECSCCESLRIATQATGEYPSQKTEGHEVAVAELTDNQNQKYSQMIAG